MKWLYRCVCGCLHVCLRVCDQLQLHCGMVALGLWAEVKVTHFTLTVITKRYWVCVCVCVGVSENVQLSGVCGSGRWEKVKWEIERERERVIVRHLLTLPSCLLEVHSFIRRQSCSAHNVELFSVCSILYAGTSTQGVSTIISTLLETENCSLIFW